MWLRCCISLFVSPADVTKHACLNIYYYSYYLILFTQNPFLRTYRVSTDTEVISTSLNYIRLDNAYRLYECSLCCFIE